MERIKISDKYLSDNPVIDIDIRNIFYLNFDQ